MLKENLNKIFDKIKNGNNLGEKILLVGATKTMPVEIINQAVSCGLKAVAENRVQEFIEKHEFIDKSAQQHFIGHLQTNKVKYLVGKVSLIHSVDSIRLAQEINRVASNRGVIQDILIEVNVGGELSKSGFDLSSCYQAVAEVTSGYNNLRVKGIMAMLPRSDDKNLLKELCAKMRAEYDKLKKDGFDMHYLSMGMSNDYEIAIENGSNLIRLGRTIFGERKQGEITNGNI